MLETIQTGFSKLHSASRWVIETSVWAVTKVFTFVEDTVSYAFGYIMEKSKVFWDWTVENLKYAYNKAKGWAVSAYEYLIPGSDDATAAASGQMTLPGIDDVDVDTKPGFFRTIYDGLYNATDFLWRMTKDIYKLVHNVVLSIFIVSYNVIKNTLMEVKKVVIDYAPALLTVAAIGYGVKLVYDFVAGTGTDSPSSMAGPQM